MHPGLTLRRVASGLFFIALMALLVVPVGSVANLPHTGAAVGSAATKVAPPAARTSHAPTKFSATDRLQLDPTTPPDITDEPAPAGPVRIDHRAWTSAPIEGDDPTARGPPAP